MLRNPNRLPINSEPPSLRISCLLLHQRRCRLISLGVFVSNSHPFAILLFIDVIEKYVNVWGKSIHDEDIKAPSSEFQVEENCWQNRTLKL
ncbi:hypothetical protein VNO77_18134 [Canavalia gladiata]|uniref:Uncharacterized protein n=1 Tax=Canavalia gladiata TaxID=3824 RepID=A0AAN9LQ81_CANGL